MNCQTTVKLSMNQHSSSLIDEQPAGVRTSVVLPESATHHPDGLTLARINALIEQMWQGNGSIPALTTALADGTAAERKWLRMERRAAETERAEVPGDDSDQGLEVA